MIELSLIDKRLLVMASGMGMNGSKDSRILLDRKKTKEVLEWADNDYERIWERVQVSSAGVLRLLDEGFSDKAEAETDNIS